MIKTWSKSQRVLENKINIPKSLYKINIPKSFSFFRVWQTLKIRSQTRGIIQVGFQAELIGFHVVWVKLIGCPDKESNPNKPKHRISKCSNFSYSKMVHKQK